MGKYLDLASKVIVVQLTTVMTLFVLAYLHWHKLLL